MALRNDISAGIKADLIAYNGALQDQAYLVMGDTIIGDSGIRFYYYDATSTATVDGESVLATTGMGGVGRYIKSIPPEIVQADWNQANSALPSFIKNKPTLKRQETFSGTTNASGVYSVSFATSYAVAPNIQANIVGGNNTQLIKITSVTASGFSVNVVNRTDVVGLLPSYSNVNGASVDVIVTEK